MRSVQVLALLTTREWVAFQTFGRMQIVQKALMVGSSIARDAEGFWHTPHPASHVVSCLPKTSAELETRHRNLH
jgi:hypothetical protein